MIKKDKFKIDIIKPTSFYSNETEKTKLNWFLYELSLGIYDDVQKNLGKKLKKYRIYDETLAKFSVYFSKNMKDVILQKLSGKIDEEMYFVEPDEQWAQKSMDTELGDVLTIRKRFYHDYDFGSTTHLMLRVVLEREGEIKDRSIKILARNDPPLIICQECGKLATKFCTGCSGSEGGGWFCDDCAEKHKCERGMFLPVVNSPRVGVCGYSG